MRIKGSVAVVTGASSGIGRAVALDLARRGARVALLGRRREVLEEVAGLAERDGASEAGAGRGRTLVVPVDVTSADAVTAAFDLIEAELGPPDILVNAAGFAVWKPFAATTVAEHDEMMAVNYWGTFHTLRAVLAGMRSRRRGAIVNISAGSGKFALAVTGGFSASKFAVTGLSESLHRELRGSGVRISCLHPGSVKTPFWSAERTPAAGIPPLVRYSPKLRPEAVARSVRWCLLLGMPTMTTPLFVALFARLNALWIRLGDLMLWRWFFPVAGALVTLRVLSGLLGDGG